MGRTFVLRSVAAATLVATVAFLSWPRTETETGSEPLEPVVLQAQAPAEPASATVRSHSVEFRKRDSFIALLLRQEVPPADGARDHRRSALGWRETQASASG